MVYLVSLINISDPSELVESCTTVSDKDLGKFFTNLDYDKYEVQKMTLIHNFVEDIKQFSSKAPGLEHGNS